MKKMKKIAAYFCLNILILGLYASVGTAHEWMAPKKNAALKNPVEMDIWSIEDGKTGYMKNCALCHRENLEGTDGRKLGFKKDPANLKERIKEHSDGGFFWKIQEGRGDMPSFKKKISDQEIWQIIHFIRSESEIK